MGVGKGKEVYAQKKATMEIHVGNVNEQQQKSAGPVPEQPKEELKSVKERLTGRMTVAGPEVKLAEKAFGGEQEGEMEQIKGRISYQKMSVTAEERMRLLKNGGTMTEEQKQQYRQEYERWSAHSDNFKELCGRLLSDEEKASSEFQAVKDNMEIYFKLFQQPISDSVQYREVFMSARRALKQYYSTHNRPHATKRGRRRWRLVENLCNLMDTMEAEEAERILEAKKEEVKNAYTDENAYQKGKELENYLREGSTGVYKEDEAKWKETIEKGTLKEKFRAFFQAYNYFAVAENYIREMEQSGVFFPMEKETNSFLEDILSEKFQTGTKMEMMEAAELLASINMTVNKELYEEFSKFRAEAPDGEDADSYAKAKLKYSPVFQKLAMMQMLTNALQEENFRDYYKQIVRTMAENNPMQAEMNNINSSTMINEMNTTYEEKLSLKTQEQLNIQAKYQSLQEFMVKSGMFSVSKEKNAEPLTAEQASHTVQKMKKKREALLRDHWYRRNVPEVEEIPNEESEEAKQQRRERQTRKIQELAGHDGVDYVAYNIYTRRWKQKVMHNNSMERIEWIRKVEEYNGNHTKEEIIESRIFTVFMKGHMQDEIGNYLTQEDEKNFAHDEKFVADYLSGDIERRKKYLDQYINELMNIKLTREMFEPEYIEKNYDHLQRISQMLTLYQNIFRYEKMNREYLESLPAAVRERLNAINSFPALTSLLGVVTDKYGISQTGDLNQIQSKDAMEKSGQMYNLFREATLENQEFEKLEELTRTPMNLEEEVKAEKYRLNVEKMEGFFRELSVDQEKASEEFQAVKDTVAEYSSLFSQPVTDSERYREVFLSAKKALQKYVDTHKSKRHSERGERRQRLTMGLLEHMKSMEESERDKLVEAKKREAANYFTEERLRKAEEDTDYLTRGDTWKYNKDKYRKIVREGTTREKVKALFQLCKYRGYMEDHYDLLQEMEVVSLVQELDDIIAEITTNLNSLSAMEQMEVTDLFLHHYQVSNARMFEAYNRYKAEAPEGADADTYAKICLKNSSFAAEYSMIPQMRVNLSAMDDIATIYTETARQIAGHHVEEEREKGKVAEALLSESTIQKLAEDLPDEVRGQIDTSEYYGDVEKFLKSGVCLNNKNKPLTKKQSEAVLNKLWEKRWM